MNDEDRRLLEAVPQGQSNMLKELLSEVGQMGNLEIYALQRCSKINGTGRRAGKK